MSGAAHVRIARARGQADQAKSRLMGTVEEAKARLAPGKLASDAVQSAKDKSIVAADDAVAKVKERPGLTAGIATVAALFIARRPLFAAVRGLFRGSDEGKDQSTNQTNTTSRRRADEMEELNG
jgi:ElaB/YqjD/DUF883 family membrane-anchored ribosome-binding protein